MNTFRFLGHECVELKNKSLSLIVTQSVGPRIISLRLGDSENILAELPTQTLDCPGVGDFHFYGGHRLWHAPEIPCRTNLPDDQPVEIMPIENGLQVTQAVEIQTGLQKSMRISLPDNSPTVVIDHTLENSGLWPVPCALWAITQLKTGGTAILPQNAALADPDGVQPNRSLVLWPYTDINNAQIRWGNDYITIESIPGAPNLKVGYPNLRGWLGYLWQDMLFIKWADYDPTASYYDANSSSQCFCGPEFLELETLGPSSVIPPGESLSHRETWRIFDDIELDPDEEAIQPLVTSLSLDMVDV